jgi:hypothetical protein
VYSSLVSLNGTRPCCKMATPQQKAFCILQFAKTNSVTSVQRGLPWRRRPETLSRLNYKQTFQNFPNNCISRDCSFIINMLKCYLVFELPCTLRIAFDNTFNLNYTFQNCWFCLYFFFTLNETEILIFQQQSQGTDSENICNHLFILVFHRIYEMWQQ